jgi:hypothetical protein
LTCIEQLNTASRKQETSKKKTKLKTRQTQHNRIFFIGTHKLLLHYVTSSSVLLAMFTLASYQRRY